MEENAIGIDSCFVWTPDRSLWKTWEERGGQRRAKKTCVKKRAAAKRVASREWSSAGDGFLKDKRGGGT